MAAQVRSLPSADHRSTYSRAAAGRTLALRLSLAAVFTVSRGDGGHLGQRGRAMTIHHEAQDFIVRPDTALVLLSTTETPRLVPLPPLGLVPQIGEVVQSRRRPLLGPY